MNGTKPISHQAERQDAAAFGVTAGDGLGIRYRFVTDRATCERQRGFGPICGNVESS